MKKYTSRGFTLIELMIVVAIIGILVAIAYPSYSKQVLKGRRAEGRTALADLLQQEERYLTQRNTYLAFDSDASTGAPTPANAPFKTWSGDTWANSAYRLTATTCTALSASPPTIQDCVQVNAVPLKPDTEAGTLQMTSTGLRTCSGGTNSAVCWK